MYECQFPFQLPPSDLLYRSATASRSNQLHCFSFTTSATHYQRAKSKPTSSLDRPTQILQLALITLFFRTSRTPCGLCLKREKFDRILNANLLWHIENYETLYNLHFIITSSELFCVNQEEKIFNFIFKGWQLFLFLEIF